MSILKFINTFILKPIFIISIILIGVLSALVLYAVISSKADLGSLPDWISAACSLGTMYIAWLAFRAAPNWIRQKLDETALVEADIYINSHYHQLKIKLASLSLAFNESTSLITNPNSNAPNMDDFSDSKSKLDELISEIDIILESIRKSEETLRRKGWFVKQKYSFMDVFGVEKMSINIALSNYSNSLYFFGTDLYLFKLDGISSSALLESKERYKAAIVEFSQKFELMRKVTFGIFKHKNPIISIFNRH